MSPTPDMRRFAESTHIRHDAAAQSGAELDSGALYRLSEWFARHVPGAEGALTAELIAGGKSNLTYRVSDQAGNAWAVRRPPRGPKAPTAHNVHREHRIIAALYADSIFPVAAPGGICSDENVLGAPFMVTEFVDGIVLRTRRIAAELPQPVRSTTADTLIDALAQLHKLAPTDLGLQDLAPPTGYLQRQLARWRTQYDRSRQRGIDDIESMHVWLAENLPPSARPCLVHGDYRLDNAIFDQDGRLAAVLDWEIATIGDPLADLALMVVYWAGPGAEAVGPTALPGFPDRTAVIARYTAATGADITYLRWYLAFSYWKLACAAEGIFARYAAGGGGGDQSVKLDQIADVAPTLAARARQQAESEGTVT
jgi:aminoglycoside phosphotransferase (APT) family kinase protein